MFDLFCTAAGLEVDAASIARPVPDPPDLRARGRGEGGTIQIVTKPR